MDVDGISVKNFIRVQVVAVLNPLAKEKLTEDLQDEIQDLQQGLQQAHQEVVLPPCEILFWQPAPWGFTQAHTALYLTNGHSLKDGHLPSVLHQDTVKNSGLSFPGT